MAQSSDGKDGFHFEKKNLRYNANWQLRQTRIGTFIAFNIIQ